MAKIISLASQKGGVGKSVSAVNLAYAFAIGGYKILLIDFDSQGSVRTSLGIQDSKAMGTKELLTKSHIPLEKLISKLREQNNLDVICSNIRHPSEEKTIFQICNKYDVLARSLKNKVQNYDFVILDAPASTNSLVINVLYASDYIILPLQCDKLAVDSLSRFLTYFKSLQSQIKNKELKLAGLLFTMFKESNLIHRRVCEQIYETLGNSVFQTIIPFDNAIVEANALKKPIFSYQMHSAAATAYISLMKEVVKRYELDSQK